jgi:hypothetical protein
MHEQEAAQLEFEPVAITEPKAREATTPAKQIT